MKEEEAALMAEALFNPKKGLNSISSGGTETELNEKKRLG
jgi:hypothetical protein